MFYSMNVEPFESLIGLTNIVYIRLYKVLLVQILPTTIV